MRSLPSSVFVAAAAGVAVLLALSPILAPSSAGMLLLQLGIAACAAMLWFGTRRAAPATPAQDFADLPACLPDLVWQIDYANRSAMPLNTLKYDQHPMPAGGNNRISSLFPTRIARQYLESLIVVQSSNKPLHFEYKLGNDARSARAFEVRMMPRDAKSCVALIRDVSALKDAEEALFQQQLFLNQVIDVSPNLIYVRDRHGRFLLVNRATQTTLGHDLLVQSHMGTDDDALPFSTGDEEVLEHGQTIRVVDHWTLPSGRTHWFDITKQPLVRDGDVYILSMAIDISHVKAAEDALAVTDPLGSDIADALPCAFLLVCDGQIEFANLRACELLNTPPVALLGRPIDLIAGTSLLPEAGETQRRCHFTPVTSEGALVSDARTISSNARTVIVLKSAE
ncbi:PAS domain-containing protein [Jeongeupia naejangsanensis]|uniref:PAS domain-containing protein n=1 Tax=Jeongeupia naejangsanensis TaxID=613195 RepID=A0ABS2BKS0_9NEIS|nr:PAS domain-containing protein [Jeongeupia naejangsanensis]MBM3115414.1 PAS domain-containing protein [Jeongeupia naejangsanensis]